VAERLVAFDELDLIPAASWSSSVRGTKLERAIAAACDALLRAESRLTELDSVTGDGDLGFNMTRAARAVQFRLGSFPFQNPSETLKALGLTLQEVLGGSSGPLYGVLLLRAANSLDVHSAIDARAWAAATLEGCDAVSELGGATLGDRTMLDALIPFVRTFAVEIAHGAPFTASLSTAAAAAERGAEQTASMTARRGRSSYLGERVLGTPDPGAIAAATWLRAVVSSLV
jgi:dihydroxyacetone kinase